MHTEALIAPTSYVASLRKQKATVWSDQAQYKEPGEAKQRKHARRRAAIELSRSLPAWVGNKLPDRLSASEVEESERKPTPAKPVYKPYSAVKPDLPAELEGTPVENLKKQR